MPYFATSAGTRARRRPARIAIVDDHATIRVGVRATLGSLNGIEVVAATDTVAALMELGHELDLVLLDLRLNDGSTVTANVEALQAAGIPVLIFTSGENPSLIREAARTGAVGMLRKSEESGTVARAIISALRGDVVASIDWAAAIDGDPALRDAGLTARELEVLALYASGARAEHVAGELGISRETVLDHVRRIRSRYAAVDRGAPTKVDLYRRAIEDGVIPDSA